MSKLQFIFGAVNIFLAGANIVYGNAFVSLWCAGIGIWLLWPALNKSEPPVIK